MKTLTKITLTLALLASSAIQAQTLSTKSKKAIAYYLEADNYRVRRQNQQAIELLSAAIRKDDEFVEAYAMLGAIYHVQNQLTLAEQNLIKAISLRPLSAKSLKPLFTLSKIQITLEKYLLAQKNLKSYMKLGGQGNPVAKLLISKTQYALANIDKSLTFSPEPLNERINQFAMQYFPVTTADDSVLFYTKRNGSSYHDDEDIMVAYRTADGDWGRPESISPNINTQLNEGTCSVSADGRTLVFTSCQGRKGYGSCDLYISYKQGDEWLVPINMGSIINSRAWESQPSLSADGRTLYYVSNRPGGQGGRDLWVSYKKNDKWTTPQNMGDKINTPFEEVSPFIHPNGEILYFSSDGLAGFGGYDIYATEKKANKWSSPENFGYPINRGSDQMSLVISANGQLARYSESNHQGKQSSKIYEFEVPREARIKNTSIYLKGTVLDATTNRPLNASLELIDLTTSQIVGNYTSDSITGQFLSVLNKGGNYAYFAQKTGYVYKSYNFSVTDQQHNPTIKIRLKPIKKGVKTVLSNIFFDHDSYALKEISKTELSKVASFIRSNDVKLEIGGYTDATGGEAYNQKLSENRAKAVYDYLTTHFNVPTSTLFYKGYGIDKATNNKQYHQSRRIEFKVM